HIPRPPPSTLFPYTTLFRSHEYFRLRRLERVDFGDQVPRLDELPHLLLQPGCDYDTSVRCEDRHAVELALQIDTFRFGLRHFVRSEEHTSELQSRSDLVCRL